MKTILKPSIVVMVLGLAASMAGHASAQSTGQWLGRVGFTHLAPSTSSGTLTLAPQGSQIDVGSASQLSGGLTYMFSDNLSVDVPLSLPFKLKVQGAGSYFGGAGQVATAKVLPMMVIGQYRFGAANAQFRPYLGGGLVYADFHGEKTTALLSAATGGTPRNPTTVQFDDKVTVAAQAGLKLNVTGRWFLDANFIYVPLKTKGVLSTGQTIDTKLNPMAFSLTVGTTF
jgi:outer membrane protein